MQAAGNPDRFTTLDALRGIAAVMVMLFHVGPGSALPARAGYLAVDMFFLLSGFVIAHAYEGRLRAGLSLRGFVWLRLARIYPMYLLGTGIGAWLVVYRPGVLLMIPDPVGEWLYPANVPMWSLLFELAISVAFAALAVRTGWRGIAAILAASGALLIYAAFGPWGSIGQGGKWAGLWLGLPRTAFSFTLGAALFRLHRNRGAPRGTHPLGWLIPAALAAALALFPIPDAWWELACVFAIFPALLWLGIRWDLPFPQPARLLGDLSYPLYCIQSPLIWYAGIKQLPLAPVCLGLLLGAWALDRWVDKPVRTALAALVRRRIIHPPVLRPIPAG